MADTDSRAGLVYFTRALLDWTTQVHAPHDAALQQAFDAPARAGMPAIQLAPSEAKLTELLLRLAGAKKVVEVGTLAGYSALRLARALPPDGHVHTIEFDEKHAQVARDVIAKAGESQRITVHVGRGVDVLPTLEKLGPFDGIFIDADKESYDLYGRWAAQHLRRGGLLLGDNVFLFGQLLDETPRAQAMRRFHEEARAHFDTVCIPTPDGLLLGVRR
ncbi:MAG: O-methyltransferase [Myxococcaceae bacterium]